MLSVMEKNFIKQFVISVFVFLAVTGCAGQSPQAEEPKDNALSDFGPAPELSNVTWLNSDQPLRLKNLRGKVVLLEMWTFG